jgi:hypothetical protein
MYENIVDTDRQIRRPPGSVYAPHPRRINRILKIDRGGIADKTCSQDLGVVLCPFLVFPDLFQPRWLLYPSLVLLLRARTQAVVVDEIVMVRYPAQPSLASKSKDMGRPRIATVQRMKLLCTHAFPTSLAREPYPPPHTRPTFKP